MGGWDGQVRQKGKMKGNAGTQRAKARSEEAEEQSKQRGRA